METETHEWYSGTESKLYVWVKSKSKWNAEIEKLATGGDGDTPRDNNKAINPNHLGDPVDIQTRLEVAWRGIWREKKTRGVGWGV